MPRKIDHPTDVPAAGNPPKIIREYIGRVNSLTETISVAHMVSPSGWSEPGQRPDFLEYTVVLRGQLLVENEKDTLEINAGQAVISEPREWVRYSSPGPEGAEYIAVCVPAFSIETVHRDAS